MKLVTPVLLATLVVLSTGAMGSVGTETVPTDSSPTEIDSCTIIDEPGRYVLVEDIDHPGFPREPNCIEIRADDVVLDGQGHRLIGPGVIELEREPADQLDDELIPPPTGVSVSGDDVTVENLKLSGWRPSVAVGGNDSEITHLTVSISEFERSITFESGLLLYGQRNTVRDSEFRVDGDSEAISVAGGSDHRLQNNQIRLKASSASGIQVADGTGGVTVVENKILGEPGVSTLGVEIRGSESTVSRNQIRSSTGISLFVAKGAALRNNAIRSSGVGIDVVSANATVRNNLLRGTEGNPSVGVRIDQRAELRADLRRSSVALSNNTIRDYRDGVHLAQGTAVAAVGIHDNVFRNNSEYGVHNENTEPVNATGNYWGAPDGPSSSDDPDAPFADPVTGTLADGEGDAVSENPEEFGISNVHFDPWLNQPVMNVIGNFENPPTDPDGDGKFEDVNGDGEFDIVDVQALFANRTDSTIQNNPEKFDFNGDDTFDVVDVQALFTELTEET